MATLGRKAGLSVWTPAGSRESVVVAAVWRRGGVGGASRGSAGLTARQAVRALLTAGSGFWEVLRVPASAAAVV